MWNVTLEVWIFWHLFFTLATAAVIAFEGSLIHLCHTLLFPESETWLVFDTCPLFISSHVSASFVAVFVWRVHTALLWVRNAASGRQCDFIDGLLFLILGVRFSLTVDLLVFVLQWHRWRCFFRRFKRGKSVLMKVPFKEAKVRRE